MTRSRTLQVLTFLLLLTSGCGDSSDTPPARSARPVTTVTIQRSEPTHELRVTGVLGPFREEDIAFEVGGRVVFVANLGYEARGAVYDGEGVLVEEGTVLAELDDERYRLARESARLAKEAAEKNLEALRIELDQVADADLDRSRSQLQVAETQVKALEENLAAARSELDLARTTLERQRALVRQGASAQATLDEAENAFRAADANVKRLETELRASRESLATYRASVTGAEAAIELKRARYEAARADVDQLQQKLAVAERDLRSCKLRAPFDGRVTVTHVGRGTVVSAGQTVVTMTMFDPIQVSISLSAEQNRQVHMGRPVRITMRGEDTRGKVIFGAVMAGREVAEAATRTFSADILARNPRREDSGVDGGLRIQQLYPVLTRYVDREGPLYVNTRCIGRDGDRAFVLKIPGSRWGSPELQLSPAAFRPVKIPVTLRDDYMMVLQWSCRHVEPAEPMRDGDLVIMDPERYLDETGEPRDVLPRDGRTWEFRPGDLVTVDIPLEKAPEGFYVPLDTIVTSGEESWVFAVREDRARRIDVRIGPAFDSRRLVRADELLDGEVLVRFGRHYVHDGDPVVISDLAERLELQREEIAR